MPIITLNPGQLEQVATQFDQHQQAFEGQLQTMQNQIQSLEGDWQGLGQQAFETLMAQWTKDYTDMLAVLGRVTQLLKVASASFAETDQEVANKLNQILG